jgi:hypothetical protein
VGTMRFGLVRATHTLALLALLLASPLAHAASVTLQNGTATCSQNFSGSFMVDDAIDGVVNQSTGWGIFCDGAQALAQTAVFETATDVLGPSLLTFVLEQKYTFTGSDHTIGRFRLSATTESRANFADGLNDGGNLGLPGIWTVLDPTSIVSTNGATLTEQGDNSVLASGPIPGTATYTVMVPTNLSPTTGIRLELLEDASLPFSGPGREPTNGNLILSELELDAVACTTARLDVDDDETTGGALTDGLLLLRYVFGFRDATLVTGAVGDDCSRCLASAIEPYIASIGNALDVDGDGTVGALTDTLLVLRYAFGFRGSVLTAGAVDGQCTRCEASQIEAYLACLFA